MKLCIIPSLHMISVDWYQSYNFVALVCHSYLPMPWWFRQFRAMTIVHVMCFQRDRRIQMLEIHQFWLKASHNLRNKCLLKVTVGNSSKTGEYSSGIWWVGRMSKVVFIRIESIKTTSMENKSTIVLGKYKSREILGYRLYIMRYWCICKH